MGVTILQQFPILENKTAAATIDYLSKRILALGGVQTGQFLVDCETFVSTQTLMGVPSKSVHILHDSEYPASIFSILDTGTKHVSLVADSLFDLLILKFAPLYTSKKQTKIESKGPRFELNDLLIKLGTVTMSQSFKGILIEIEYRPCIIPVYCWELMREFVKGFMGTQAASAMPQYFVSNLYGVVNKHNDKYEPLDTILQYLEHFTNYRKQMNPIVNIRN